MKNDKCPSWLLVGCSYWFGTTLFARKSMKKGKIICMTKFNNIDKVEKRIISPDGFIFNHSEKEDEVNTAIYLQDNDLIKIVAIRDIEFGEELLTNHNDLRKENRKEKPIKSVTTIKCKYCEAYHRSDHKCKESRNLVKYE